MAATVHLTLDEAEQLTLAALRRHGASERHARAAADVMLRAERDGCPSHGLFRLPGHVASLKSGKVKGDPRPRIETLAPSVIRCDGDDGFAPLALEAGREALIEAAGRQGIAALSLVRVHHFSALWCDIEPLCEAGLAAMAFTAYLPCVVPAGGRERLFGTNPMACAWPRPGKAPVVFDQASAAMARGEIQIAAREGQSVPEGVGIGPDGEPTTDPGAILEGAQLAFGGHKGANIALMVELLAGALIGERFSFEAEAADNRDGGPPRGGELVLALDPARFGDAEGWAAHAEALFGRMEAMAGVRLPGARRHDHRRRTPAAGITFPEALHSEIRALAGMPP